VSGAFTAKNYQIADAPARIKLRGDKTRKTESAQHIIEFPGGAIEVSRCENGDYWAHIIVNRDPPIDDTEGLKSATAEIVDGRMDYLYPHSPVERIPNAANLTQIAIRICPLASAKGQR
jgi:hypothetical protein